ncbi:caspase-8 [Drosophila innubila]|uniref:caspase-8 n=1 Tax=Drosophila innubila TaxID=198719 RepID=UPI00148E4747|nr:caspase-8 [Drosophila innubila]
MSATLDNIQIEDLLYVEYDLNFAQKVSLSFLLFGDQHSHATYILQKLLALVRSPAADQRNSDILRLYAQSNPAGWRCHLVEALCIINARQVLRKLGFDWEQLRLQYLPQILEISLHIHPLLKALYFICEQLTIAQSGRLVLDINEKLSAINRSQGDEPLRFYDFAYLEIFLLDWLTRRHLRLGDIQTIGSDVQLLIDYFKFNDLHSLATLLIQTYNTNAKAPVNKVKCESDAQEVATLPPQPTTTTTKVEAATSSPNLQLVSNNSNGVYSQQQQQQLQQQLRAGALQVQRDNAGILLIINQHSFHQDVSDDLRPLLPDVKLWRREGTDVDKERLSEVFSALGYRVEAHNNVDHLAMLELIRTACSRSMLRDSLIVCILSHGFEGAVYGCDSIPVRIDDIKNVLCADENLYDKPKFLIIQACQQNGKNCQTRNVNATTRSPSQHANMVVAMSTVPGFVALRHSVNGSWFIQTLCDAVEQHAASEHVLDIFTRTIGEVSQKRGDKNQEMLPSVTSTLQQKVYLPAI